MLNDCKRLSTWAATTSLMAGVASFLACQESFAPTSPTSCEPLSAGCGFGSACVEETCVQAPNRNVAAAFVLTPPPGSPFAATALGVHSITAGSEPVNFDLPEPVRFESVFVTDPFGETIGARIVMFLKDSLGTRDPIAEHVVRAAGSGIPLLLVPATYTVRIFPLDRRYPGIEIPQWVVTHAVPNPKREFQIPSQYRILRGEVRLRTAQHLGVAGVRVEARSIPTGLPSTSTVTDAAGEFVVRLPDCRDTSFRLTAKMDAPQIGSVWHYEQIVAVNEHERFIRVEFENPREVARGTLKLVIVGVGVGDEAPISGARVTLTSSSGLSSQRFFATGTSDERGRVFDDAQPNEASVAVVAGVFEVDVQPSDTSPYGHVKKLLDLRDIRSDVPVEVRIALPLRARIRGAVRSPSGEPVPDALVALRSRDGAQRVSTRTDEAGAYSLAVDEGTLDAFVQPKRHVMGSSLVADGFFTMNVPVGTKEMDVPSLELDEGTLLSGIVRGDGKPVSSVRVSAFLGPNESLLRELEPVWTSPSGHYALVISGETP